MKRRQIGFIVCALMAQTVGSAQGGDLTCQVYGGAFVLDDSDFKSLTERNKKLTKEFFTSLPATSEVRIAICDTRGLWRAIKTGKARADKCWNDHYPKNAVGYLANTEVGKLTPLFKNVGSYEECHPGK